MNNLVFFITIPNLVILLLFYFLNRKSVSGSDHEYHISLIAAIKRNKNRFVSKSPFIVNEANFTYPQLFHWILSYFSEKICREKHIYINLVIKLVEIISFNFFLFFLYKKIGFEEIVFLYANIIVNVFPFSYAVWNAKNSGLSARGIGLVAGQIYSYLIVAYVFSGNLFLLFLLFTSVFVTMLLSQMAFQYVLLSLPFFAIFLKIPEIIMLPFLSFFCYYVIMPKIAKKYILGQYYHKRTYALFLADIYILKNRPSIYRDFIYDFWIKLKKNFISGMAYIYFNPLVEIIYGLPFLWFVIYIGFKNNKLYYELNIMNFIVLSALCVFFLTSFRITRFLGEPQRYLEFVIPIITIIYVMSFNLPYHIGLVLFSLFVIIFGRAILKAQVKNKTTKKNREIAINYLKNNLLVENTICVSNDFGFLKYLPSLGFDIIRPDLTLFYKERKDLNRYFNDNFSILSCDAIEEYVSEFKPNLLIINSRLYDFETLQSNTQMTNFLHIIELNEYSIYKIKY